MAFTAHEVRRLMRIAGDASAGATFNDRLTTVADSLCGLIPSAAWSAWVLDPQASPEEANAHTIFKNRDVGRLVEYVNHYVKIDPMAGGLPKADGNPVSLSDFVPHPDFGRDLFTSDYLPSIAVRHIIAISHRMPGGSLLAFALHRERGLRDFTPKERETMRLMSPHVARAAFGALLAEKVDALSSEVRRAARAGGILFDRRAEVVYANPDALELIKRIAPSAGSPLDSVAILVRRFARHAVETDGLDRTLGLEGGGWLSLRLSLVGQGPGASVLAVFAVLEPGSVHLLDAFCREAKLTAREREVVTLAIRGFANREIARRLRVSTVTVGTHLGNVYMKSGVHDRIQLTTTLLGAPPSGGPPAASRTLDVLSTPAPT